eukprot:Phypoly_transcript_09426.p1 GENE.Phypoly_transcript_09426~~Phypoly_transcript_09426.p1  ORF type:complete len:292 (-),score=71.63 Phypoly_transcript_09426:532-1296(-)
MAEPENEIQYITNAKDIPEVCKRLKEDATQDSVCVLGLDCEWSPSWQKGVPNLRTAVVQLSSASLTAVFHVSAFLPKHDNNLPAPLAELLQDKEILKVVLGNQDPHKIKGDFGITIDSIDLQKMNPRLKGVGLRQMTEELLQKTLKKSKKLPSWERAPLKPDMLLYAALDAEITRKLYFVIKDHPNIPIFHTQKELQNKTHQQKQELQETKQEIKQAPKPKTDLDAKQDTKQKTKQEAKQETKQEAKQEMEKET